ncbi:methyltransferase [Ferrovibrio sp.]|uniref:class I SAM-dependent DNA methyltransferase n=1 Tax=Ferrovibrio sp. TaxID=1917215 RepID=UPI0025BE2F3F|nr:methyltransferase [Ferrovibrio sp.]MBX3453193.1 methyltransferase domain-containing protein [Ferrovibrio sp.]
MNRKQRRQAGKAGGNTQPPQKPVAATSISDRLLGLAGKQAMPGTAALPAAFAPDPVQSLLAAEKQKRQREEEFARQSRALAANPQSIPLLRSVAQLALRLDKRAEAGAAYAGLHALLPDDPEVAHMHAVLSGSAPARPDPAYVAGLFDAFADTFDRTLTHWLEYRAPKLVADAARAALVGIKAENACDLGCGTGLLGPEIRDLCTHLSGIDLSPRMIEKARERKLYDALDVAEIVAWLQARPAKFDLLLAADVLAYFGALEDAFAAIRAALRPGGIFVATVEADALRPDGFTAGKSGRYAHGEGYIRKLTETAGPALESLALQSLARETLRQEDAKPVAGYVFVLRAA